MAAPKGGIIIDWQAMAPDSPVAELEVVSSLSPPFTPHPPAVARAHTGSDDAGGELEFAKKTDRELRDKISYWEGRTKLLVKMPDGGEKMRSLVQRMKKELERRRVDGQRKDGTDWRQVAQAKSTNGNRGDAYAFNPDDEVLDSTTSKNFKNSSCPSSAKTYNQVKRAAYKEGSSLSHDKCAYVKKDCRIGKYSVDHQLKTSSRLPKNTDCERLNMDIERRKKSTLRSCTRYPQKNNTNDSKGTYNKFREDDTFGSNRRFNLAEKKASASSKFKRDVVLLDDDKDSEPAGSTAAIEISDKRDESKIYYPSRTDPDAVELTYSDMKCLEPEEYLKSPVLNFCLQYLKISKPRNDLHMFNTYFYSKLEEALSTLGDRDSQFSKLRRWWRSIDIFKKAYIILPINEMMHWSLIIVCMPTKEGDSGPTILHLDSLGLHNSEKLFDIVVRYLEAEWRHLQKDSSYDIPFSGMIWKRLHRYINKETVEVPRQRNEYDCGLFMLYYIEKFIQEAPERLTKESLGMFGRKWFNHEEVSTLRERIRALLFDLAHSMQKDNEQPEPEWLPGKDKDADTAMAISL